MMRRRISKVLRRSLSPPQSSIPKELDDHSSPPKKKPKCSIFVLVLITVQLCTLRWFWYKLSRPLPGVPGEKVLEKKTLSFGEDKSNSIEVTLKAHHVQRVGDAVSDVGNANVNVNTHHNDVDVDVVDYYRVQVTTTCRNAAVHAYLGKDALAYITLTEVSPMHWAGTFSCPVKGEYVLRVLASGCEKGSGKLSDYADLLVAEFLQEVDHVNIDNKKEVKVNVLDGLFAKGGWFSSSKVQIDASSAQQPSDYIWIDPITVRDEKEVKSIDGPDKFVVEEGSVIAQEGKGFFDFKSLSNYELVCFFGSQSAKDLHASLLSLRGALFPHQRPFKFHYYEVNNFDHPDESWNQEYKEKFRKCKHVLVSIDEPNKPLSQTEYKTKMITLIKHLTAAFDDETFPIIVFTNMESPIKPKNCYDPIGERTSEHPCNTVLKEIFSRSPASSRVRLLDNTDLTDPLVGDYLRSEASLAIALRIFIIVGYQVQEWRANGQVGHIDGLTRGDKEYPNFELIPYDWTSAVRKDIWLNDV